MGKNIRVKNFIVSIGWFPGENFMLFGFTFLEFLDGCFTFFDLRIAKFIFSLCKKD